MVPLSRILSDIDAERAKFIKAKTRANFHREGPGHALDLLTMKYTRIEIGRLLRIKRKFYGEVE